MSTTLIAPKPVAPKLPAPIEQIAAPVVEPASWQAINAAEQRRWFLMLAIPFAIAAAFFAASIGTSAHWLLGVAFAVGPELMIATYIYLGLTSDSNGELTE